MAITAKHIIKYMIRCLKFTFSSLYISFIFADIALRLCEQVIVFRSVLKG